MTDRDLLELAAKAAGYTLVWGDEYIVDGENIDCTDLPYVRSNQQDEADWYWNPLEDDGDALRLAVKLEITPSKHEDTVVASRSAIWRSGSAHCSFWEPSGDDPCSATRRAITRAAAEIGKAMP